ncbi:MAG: hypothetical protein MJ158_02115 [Alphaproteobacteria bacterium]|nr:hypothetical protein [Alphaproteobacteria bacterium]
MVMQNKIFFRYMTSVLLCCVVTCSFGAGRVAVNKSDQFSVADKDNSLQVKDTAMAEKIRKQKSAFAVADAQDNANSAMKSSMASNTNKCDKDLRDCMKSKCGNDFAKCAIDGDTDLGIKYDACKTKTSCNAKEFTLFTNQITEDIRFYAKISSYEKVIKCGNDYNDCIIKQCGTTFNKCLGKAQGDEAISKCATIAKNCTEQDSGLSARVGEVFGTLRQDAEKDIKKDEERMYKLRDLMRQQCEHLGALFDERSFDCVYTVNFFAGSDQSKPMSSRKAYAGGTFTCMQEWFGIDVTTHKENAYRLTKSQTGASSAMMGAGVGVAAGMITSGALDRAMETQKAKKEVKDAKKEDCSANGGEWKNGKCISADDLAAKAQEKADKENKKQDRKDARANAAQDRKDTRAENKKERADKQDKKEEACKDSSGKWLGKICECPKGVPLDKNTGRCDDTEKKKCEDKDSGGCKWNDTTKSASCTNKAKTWNKTDGKCEDSAKAKECTNGKGHVSTDGLRCECNKGQHWDITKKQCVEAKKKAEKGPQTPTE